MAFNDRFHVGISKWKLGITCLCVNLDRLEKNIDKMQTAVMWNVLSNRPHAKTHKCPEITRF
jgi:D-serine deaminase-like pyridoxal phosphate-dependent protein